MTAPPGDFLLHAVGDAPDDQSRAAIEEGQRTLLDTARPVDIGRSEASFQDGRTSAPDALDATSRDRPREIEATYDPGQVFAIPKSLTKSL